MPTTQLLVKLHNATLHREGVSECLSGTSSSIFHLRAELKHYWKLCHKVTFFSHPLPYSDMNTSHTASEDLSKLYADVKNYAQLQAEYAQLEVSNRLALLATTLIFSIIGLHLFTALLIYLTFQCAYFLAILLGSIFTSSLIIIAGYAFLILIIYLNRHRWIYRPILHKLLQAFSTQQETQAPKTSAGLKERQAEVREQMEQTCNTLADDMKQLTHPTRSTTILEKICTLVECSNSLIDGFKKGYHFIHHRL